MTTLLLELAASELEVRLNLLAYFLLVVCDVAKGILVQIRFPEYIKLN